jgi:hypothetical protein
VDTDDPLHVPLQQDAAVTSAVKALFKTPKPSITKEQLQAVDYYLGVDYFKTPQELRRQLLYAELLDKTGIFVINLEGKTTFACPPYYRRVKKTLRNKLHAIRHWSLQLFTRSYKKFFRLPLIRHARCMRFRSLRPLKEGKPYGTPIVRHYWAVFLEKHKPDIHGYCLEIGTIQTVRMYGGEALTKAEAIDLSRHSPEITVVEDLSRADQVPSDTYDCFVNQFTMPVIYDVEAALYHSIRILKPGGVLLVNFSCVDYYLEGLDMGTGAPLFSFWWFTPIQVRNMLRRLNLTEVDYELEIYGNLFARMAFQMNMSAEELTFKELEYQDPNYPLLICVRVVKPVDWYAEKPTYRESWMPDVPTYRWNPVKGHHITRKPSKGK